MVLLGSQDTPDLEVLAYSDGNTIYVLSTRIESAI